MLPDDDRTAYAEAAVWLTLIQEGVTPVEGVFECNVATGPRVAAVEGAVLSDDIVGPPSPVQVQVTVVPGETRIAGGANAKFPPLPDAPTATSTLPEPVVSATLPP